MSVSRHPAGRQRGTVTANTSKGTRTVRGAGVSSRVERPGKVRMVRRAVRSLLVLGLLCFAAWGAIEGYDAMRPHMSEWFEIRRLALTGASQVSRAEIVEWLHLSPSETLLTVDAGRIKARLESHAWIKEATVRRLPFHTLAVHVVERQPAAVLKTPTLTLLVDDEGRILRSVGEPQTPSLPVLLGVDAKGLMRGEVGSRRAVLDAIEVASLVGRDFEGRPEVHAGNPSNLVASVGGVRFLLGHSPFEEKWALYRRIRPALQSTARDREGIQGGEIDLRFPDKVIVRERG